MKKLFCSFLILSIVISGFLDGRSYKNGIETKQFDSVKSKSAFDYTNVSDLINSEKDFTNDKVIITFSHEASISIYKGDLSIKKALVDVEYDSYSELVRFNGFEDINNPKKKLIISIKLREPSKDKIIEIVGRLSKNEHIYTAAPNYYEDYCSLSPNDPYYLSNSQWGLNGEYGIDAPSAWDFTTGQSDVVTVGVIDSGIFNHEDLSSNLVEGYDFYFHSTYTEDDYEGHGTKVAGIIAAVSNTKGVVGVAPNVKVKSLQVSSGQLYNERPDDNAIISAIGYAIDAWGTTEQISVLNSSLDDFGRRGNIFNAAIQFPGPFVWAAGNYTQAFDNAEIEEEYADSNIIGVGAININGEKCNRSNYGEIVSVFAPGENIRTTTPNNTYLEDSGTSYAAPFVSGVSALLISKFPGITAQQIKTSIINGSVPFTYFGNNGMMYQTARRLSAYGALNYASIMLDIDQAPLRIKNLGKQGTNWNIRLFNPNNEIAYTSYSGKMCSEQSAKNFVNLPEISNTAINPRSFQNVNVEENGANQWVTFSIGFTIDNFRNNPPKK